MKNAIVIGATSGLGRELSRLYLENGNNVGIAGQRTQLLQSLAADYPGKASVKNLDLTRLNKSKELDELVYQTWFCQYGDGKKKWTFVGISSKLGWQLSCTAGVILSIS